MAIPLLQMYRVASYIAGRKPRGVERYPQVAHYTPATDTVAAIPVAQVTRVNREAEDSSESR
jgi:hypothetical protein